MQEQPLKELETLSLNIAQKPNIFQRVLNIMAELDYIQKGDKTVNGQYRFVSHDQVSEKIHHLLVKHKVLPLPSVKEISQDNNRTIVKLTVTFINADVPSDCFTVEFPGYGIDSGDKGPGKAVSYAYKYAILKTFNIATGEDPDKDANARYEAKKCLEFDLQIPADFTKKDRQKLNEFLLLSSHTMQKDIEDVKREALKKMPEFLAAFKNWKMNDIKEKESVTTNRS